MSRIPDDIIVNILSRLPLKSILRFRCVCKFLCKLFRDPIFVKLHLNHAMENKNFSLILKDCSISRSALGLLSFYSIYLDSSSSSSSYSCDEAVEIDHPFKSLGYGVDILGSCNGLLCIVTGEDIICLWNPSTKEYKVIPSTPIEHPRGSGILHSIRYGFGYDSKIEDYKLVRIADFLAYGHSYDSEVKIYTLGSNSWRRIQDIPYNFTFGSKSGALVNGTLHWIANRREASRLILSLDIRDETFREVPRPEYLNDQFHITIGVLGGWLCILDQYLDTVGVEVWVMKDYGVRGSWTKLYTITLQTVIQSFQYLTLVQSLKNGVILLKDNNALVLYDPKHERAGILKIPGIPEWFEPVTYVESLVSLNSCTCVGQEQTDEAIEQKIRSL